MKKIILLFIGFLLFSCNTNPVPEPENLLEESVMLDILYDTAILQAAEGYVPEKLTQNNIKVTNYIYNKYKIDSVTYYQNHKFYAADVKNYKKMYQKIMDKLDTEAAKLDSLPKIELIKDDEEVIKKFKSEVEKATNSGVVD